MGEPLKNMKSNQGIRLDDRNQEQPIDKDRASQSSLSPSAQRLENVGSDASNSLSFTGLPVKAIFFDIVGTLIDSNDFHVGAWLEAFAAMARNLTASAIHEQIGKGTDMLVEAFIAKTTVERPYEGVLHRLARRDVVPFDAGLFYQAQRGMAGQFAAVVRDDHRQPTMRTAEPIEINMVDAVRTL